MKRKSALNLPDWDSRYWRKVRRARNRRALLIELDPGWGVCALLGFVTIIVILFTFVL